MKEKEFNKLLQKIESNAFIGNNLIIDGEDIYEQQVGLDALDDSKTILLANVLKKNPNITVVELTNNNIGDIGALALAKINTIQELNLFNNNIGIMGAKALAQSNLKKLDLSSNFFGYNKSQPEIMELINTFNENRSINYLSLQYCSVPSKAIAQLIKNNKTITILNISSNNLIDKAFKCIKDNITLQQLITFNNEDLTDIAMEYISQNHSLVEIDFGENPNFTLAGAKALSKHSTLKMIRINHWYMSKTELQYYLSKNYLDNLNEQQHIIYDNNNNDIITVNINHDNDLDLSGDIYETNNN